MAAGTLRPSSSAAPVLRLAADRRTCLPPLPRSTAPCGRRTSRTRRCRVRRRRPGTARDTRHRRDGQVAAVGASGAADRGGIREPGVHQISATSATSSIGRIDDGGRQCRRTGVRSRSSHGRSARTPRCRSSAVLVERVERGPVPGLPGRRVTRSAWAPRRATTERPVGSSANLSSSTALRAAINVAASGWPAASLGRASSAAHSRLASVCR